MKTEVTLAIVSAVVALVSAGFAYKSEGRVARLTATHEREMVLLSAELTSQHERELTLLQDKLKQQHERQTPYLEEQMRLYLEAVEVAAEITFPSKSSDLDSLKTRFWQLYWGPLAVVEDQQVINAMVGYGNALKGNPEGGEVLRRHAIALAHACRDSLTKLWVINLGEFDEVTKDTQPQ